MCPELRWDVLPRKAVLPAPGVSCWQQGPDSLLPGSVKGMQKLLRGNLLLLGKVTATYLFLGEHPCCVRSEILLLSGAVQLLSIWIPVTGRTGREEGSDVLQMGSACVKLSCFSRTFHGFTRTFHDFLPVPRVSCATTRCNLVVGQCLSYSEAQEGLVELHLKCF